MRYKLLLAQCNQEVGSLTIHFTKPSQYYSDLIQKYPEIKKWAKSEIFSKYKDWPDEVIILGKKRNTANIAGEFIKANIETSTTVIEGSTTPEILNNELKKDSYTHVGLGVYVSGYSTFIECARLVREKFPNITLIAGNIGAIFKGTENYVDHVCLGRGVPFLRNLFNEDLNRPFKPGIATDKLEVVFGNQKIASECVEFVTKIGCPHNCDFCITNKFFKGQFTRELVTPQQAHDVLVDYRKKIGNRDFTIYWAEPNGITSHKWFYELFDLFRGDLGDYMILIATTASSLKNFNFDRISGSALRFGSVNIGIESFNRQYGKNQNIDLKELFSRLINYGINAYATYIIGFPNETKEDIWDGINKLLELNATYYSILNLKVLPKTPIWKQLKSENRLLNVPPDFRYIHGFQAFEHDHLKPGFEDIWPLLYKINIFIEKENGNIPINFYVLMKNLLKLQPEKQKNIKRNMILYQNIGKTIFPAWKSFFKPSEQQIQNYLAKIDCA